MSVTDLPSNVLVLLADHLTVTEILSLQRTCVTFREIFDSTMVWRSLFMRDFGWLLADMQLKDGGDYKLAYCKIAAGARAFTTGENEGPSDWGVPTQPPFVSFGQLGSPEGGIVPNLKRIKQVAAGGFHSFFLDCEGRLFSCGANAFGQLGLGDRFSRQTPCLVPMMDGVMSVSCGYAFSMAQTRDGRVFACGFAKNGRCGIEDSVISSRSEDGFPILLSFSPCCKEISSLGRLSFSCGSGHTVALASGGRVFTWGRNDQGQCGAQSRVGEVLDEFQIGVECTPNSFLPRLVLQHPSIDAVFAGAHHSIAMERHSSLVFGWGSNGVGQANPSMEASRIVEPSQWNLNSKTVLAMQVMSSDTIVALENEDGSRHLLLNGNETNFYLGRERNFKLALPFGLAVDGKLRGSAVSADTHVLLASTMTNHSVFLLVHSNVIAESFEWRKRK